MELSRILGRTGNLHPLAGQVVERDRSLEVDPNHLRWQDVCSNYCQLNLPAADTNDHVKSKHDARSKEEVSEEWILNETPRAMHKHEDVEYDVQVMRVPEGSEGVTPGILYGIDVDHNSDQRQYKGREACRKKMA